MLCSVIKHSGSSESAQEVGINTLFVCLFVFQGPTGEAGKVGPAGPVGPEGREGKPGRIGQRGQDGELVGFITVIY